MTTTESPTDTGDCSHIDVTPEEFERRLAAHGHDRGLRSTTSGSELAAMEPEAPSEATPQRRASERLLGFGPVIAVYLGLLLVVAASVSLLAIYWDSLGATGRPRARRRLPRRLPRRRARSCAAATSPSRRTCSRPSRSGGSASPPTRSWS